MRIQHLRFLFLFFFLDQRLLHCSWDMNGALRQMNSNPRVNNNFFIVFSFQQNKLYPNAPYVFYTVFNKLFAIDLVYSNIKKQ